MFKEGDRVTYNGQHYFFVAYSGDNLAIIETYEHKQKTVYRDYLIDDEENSV